MTQYAISPINGEHITAGKKYKIVRSEGDRIVIRLNVGVLACVNVKKSRIIKGNNWKIVNK